MKMIKKKESRKLNLVIIGNILIVLVILLLGITFYPVVKEEGKYQILKAVSRVGLRDNTINRVWDSIPPNTSFSIVIPKIYAKSQVFPNIDASKEGEFLSVLRKGVAHAKGTALPNENGNVYIFAHSTDAFYNVGHYNAVFYLLGKLVKGDEIIIYYNNEKIKYTVDEKKVVDPSAIEYLGNLRGGKILTLQTCYPPGTTLRRLVVVADQVD